MQEFEAKILQAANTATAEERAGAKGIIDNPQQTTVERIMPAVAAVLFTETNKHNRDFSLSKARDYAHQMELGYWRLVHQGLAYYPNKKLADGQHRLAAVFLSGTAQPFTVFRNFADDAMEAIDTAKRRTAGDAFGIIGLVEKKDAKIAGAAVERVMKYEVMRLSTRKITPSIYEQKDWATAHLHPLKIALRIAHAVTVGDAVLSKPEITAMGLGMLIGGYSEQFVEGFLGNVVQSVGAYPGAPAVNLHDQFRKSKEVMSDKKGKLDAEEKLALIFKGAALAYQNLVTGGIKWKAGKDPLPAPVPPASVATAA